jgi:hypothetical protein
MFLLYQYPFLPLHIISHLSPFGTLSLLCHHPLLHLSNSTDPVTLPYISLLPTLLCLLLYPEERSDIFLRKACIVDSDV